MISPPVITFYGGISESRVFISKPRTIQDLQQSIKEDITAIPEQMSRWVMEKFWSKAEAVFENWWETYE